MNNLPLILLPILLSLGACSGVSDDRPEPTRKSEYFLEHGVSAFKDSDFVSATNFLDKALAHYRSIDDTTGVLLTHINLAETALAAGNFDAALKNINAAEKISNMNEQLDYQQRLTLLRAQVHWRKQQTDESLKLLQGILPTFDNEQHSENPTNLFALGATTLRTDIAFASDDENMQEARLWLHRLTIMLPDTKGHTELHQARLLRFESKIAFHDNSPQEALDKLEQALKLYRDAAARPALAATLAESGQLFMQMQRWQQAEDRFQRALYIRLWIMDRIGSAELLKQLKTVYRKLGKEKRYNEIEQQVKQLNTTKK